MTLLTDAEARRQICPHIRAMTNEASVRLYGAKPAYKQAHCQGSDCVMAWRFAERGRDKFFVTYAGKPEAEWAWNPAAHPEAKVRESYKDAIVRVESDVGKGYCGIAGKPL
jgi:hypothetical protein